MNVWCFLLVVIFLLSSIETSKGSGRTSYIEPFVQVDFIFQKPLGFTSLRKFDRKSHVGLQNHNKINFIKLKLHKKHIYHNEFLYFGTWPRVETLVCQVAFLKRRELIPLFFIITVGSLFPDSITDKTFQLTQNYPCYHSRGSGGTLST